MADTVERTIYKLELDDSGYIKGVENLVASTKKLSTEQEAANKRLAENEAQLKKSAEAVEASKKALDSYTGADKKYKDQLEANLKTSQASHAKVVELVDNVRKSYEKAKKSADDFASAGAKATALQQQTTGGKIPIAPPPGIPSPIQAPAFNLTDVVPQTKAAFDQLSVAVENAENHLGELNTESQEFKTIKPVVDQAKVALQQYSDVTDDASKSTLSIRGQLRQAKEELVRLEQSGQGASKAYLELEKRTAKLTDQFNDQQQRIKILASDTKLLDFGKGAITAATSAFQTYASVSILAGSESQELQKKTMQLFAAMQLLQSLEQLSNLTRREGVIAVHLQSASQAVYTSVVGASTGALKAFRLALAATGLGAAVIAIGFLVKKYQDLAAAAKEAERESKLLSEINDEVAKSAGSEIAALEVLYKVATNLTIPIKERKKAVDELQKQYPDYFKNINDEIILQGKAASAYDATKVAILAAAKTRAIESKLSQLATDELEKDQSKQDVLRKIEKNRLEQQKADRKDSRDSETRGLDQFSAIVKKNDLQGELSDINKDLEDIAKDRDFLLNQITTAPVKAGGGGTGAGDRSPENVYIKTLRDLLARLRAASREELQSVDLIQQDFTDKLFSEIDKIDELVSKKQLTAKQGNLLVKILEKVIGKEADKTIADFKKKVTAAINKLQDELNDIQDKANIDSLNLLQDEFDRRAKLIDANEKIELDNAKEATQDRLDALELDRLLIGEKNYQDAKAVIIATGEQNALNIVAGFGQQRQDLAADIFKKSLDAFSAGLNSGFVARDEEIAKQIRATSDKFLSGKITFEQFQKDITKIQKDEESIRRDRTLDNQRSELAALDRQLASITDKTSQHYKDLLKLREQLSATISANEKEDAIKDAEEDPNKRKRDSLGEYVAATAQLADSVVQFWQRANQAESDALDRSITLQEKRVDAATKIAARGNAEYLKQESDRLKELQVQREAAARKQLGIDAALQASQVLVGITGAISKIASSPFGAETIAEIAIIIGALATGYGIVKSLQGNQPRLAKGDPYVKRGNNPAGIDTIPAWLNEGEAVTSAEKNKAYHPVIRAIHDGTVPADQLNNFVKTYHKIKSVPQVDYSRIEGAAQLSIGQDGKMIAAMSEQNRLIMENNDLQRATLRAMGKMSISANIDRDGVAIMVNEYMKQMEIDKHT